MNRSEFISICKECDITIDGDVGYWKTYPVIYYNADEETIYSCFYLPEKSYKEAKENALRRVNTYKELELSRKQNMLKNKLEKIKDDFI